MRPTPLSRCHTATITHFILSILLIWLKMVLTPQTAGPLSDLHRVLLDYLGPPATKCARRRIDHLGVLTIANDILAIGTEVA